MAQKRKPNQSKVKSDLRQKIAGATLDLAAKKGWASLSFGDIAKKAKLKTPDIEKYFSDIWDIALWILADIEVKTQEQVSGYLGDNWQDNMMEIIMTRLDIADQDRDAFVNLAREMPQHPKAFGKLGKTGLATIRNMMVLGDMPKNMINPPLIATFLATYLSIVHTWTTDTTTDKTKTMAAIDKRLGYFEMLAEYLQCKGRF